MDIGIRWEKAPDNIQPNQEIFFNITKSKIYNNLILYKNILILLNKLPNQYYFFCGPIRKKI